MLEETIQITLCWRGDPDAGINSAELTWDTGISTIDFTKEYDYELDTPVWREDIRNKAIELGISITGDTPNQVVFNDECRNCGKLRFKGDMFLCSCN